MLMVSDDGDLQEVLSPAGVPVVGEFCHRQAITVRFESNKVHVSLLTDRGPQDFRAFWFSVSPGAPRLAE